MKGGVLIHELKAGLNEAHSLEIWVDADGEVVLHVNGRQVILYNDQAEYLSGMLSDAYEKAPAIKKAMDDSRIAEAEVAFARSERIRQVLIEGG